MMRKQFNDSEFDALVVRSLSRLPSHAPSRVFSDKVMDRVQLPSPKAVRAYRRARSWALQPRRALMLAGAYAGVATLALLFAVPWLLRNSPSIRVAFDWVVARGMGAFRDVAIAVTGWTVSSGIAGLFTSIPLTGPQIWALALAATAVYAGCAIGLHYLLRAPRARHVSVQIQA